MLVSIALRHCSTTRFLNHNNHLGMRISAIFFVMLVAARLAAQTAAPLTIAVTDENGSAVSHARVALQKPPDPPFRCETDFSGRCRFAAVPHGDYELGIEKEGFYALAERQLEIGQSPVVEVVISHQQEVREVINVQESAPAIDPAQISAQQTLSGLDILNIPYPTTHDYRNVLNFIPGVVQDNGGQPHIAGAETYQTVTVLDGFNITQPANGQVLARISSDAFRSIQVEPARESAEFGKGSGGLLLLNTGIGDDHFRLFGTDFIPSFQNKGGWRFDQFLPRLTFSGPLQKRRLWFYDAIDGEYDNTVYTELPANADNDHFLRVGNLAKLQANLTSRNIVTTSFLFNHLHDDYAFLSPQSPQQANPSDIESADIASVKDQHYFSGGNLFEAGAAFDQYNLKLTPYGTSPYFVNPETAGGNYYLAEQTEARRWQALANLFLAPHHWHGRHDFKVGADFDRLSYNAQFARQPISFLLQGETIPAAPATCMTVALPSPCSRYSTFSGGSLSSTYNFESSAYAEDRWLITGRLLVEPGVRLDWDEVIRTPLLSPRLAGTYVLDNSGNTKLSAGIGLVYDPTILFLLARPHAGERTDYFFNQSGDPTDANGNAVAAPTPVLTTFSVDRSNLQEPRFINWSLGLEKKLPAAVYLKAEFLEKRGSRGFVYNTVTGSSGNFLLENTRDDRYDALELTVRHSFREGHILMGSYTRSRDHSDQALDFNVDGPLLSPQRPGPYPWDTPNRFLSWGYVPFFKLPIIRHTEIAWSSELRTGFPFNVTNDQEQLVGAPGSQRFPEYFSLNLQLEKRFHLFGYFWALRGGFDNITNHANPYVVNSDINSPQFLTFSAFQGRSFTSRIRLLDRK